jgi:hypothetical protein
MDFEGTLTKIRIAQAELDGLEFVAMVEKGKIQAGMRNLVGACEPVCIKAVEGYNAAPVLSLLITPVHKIRIFINPTTRTFSLIVRMRYQEGGEPDEDFNSDEVQQIQAALQPHLEREFREASIPLSFTNLQVPYGYHLR